MFPIRFVEVAVLVAKQQRELQVADELRNSSDAFSQRTSYHEQRDNKKQHPNDA